VQVTFGVPQESILGPLLVVPFYAKLQKNIYQMGTGTNPRSVHEKLSRRVFEETSATY